MDKSLPSICGVYRPPSEADSLLIQATIGCPHNKCTFCGMYKGKKFRIRSVKEIKNDILAARELYGDVFESAFFPDGNTIIMKTAQLEEIFIFTRKTFPRIRRITLYASAKFLKIKTLGDLRQLKKAGLDRLHKGLESGNDEILKRIQKGADAKLMIETGQRVKEAGIELSEYVLVGIGGKELWKEHALDTAKVLNAINPDFIRLRTWVPVPNAPLTRSLMLPNTFGSRITASYPVHLKPIDDKTNKNGVYKDYQSGKFQLLSPHEALKETRLLLENLEADSLFLSDHISNFVNISGHLPRDKQGMIDKIDRALKMDESSFRPQIIEHL
ncbi:MAG: radical SAM protein [Planctomycetota bacterium]